MCNECSYETDENDDKTGGEKKKNSDPAITKTNCFVMKQLLNS